MEKARARLGYIESHIIEILIQNSAAMGRTFHPVAMYNFRLTFSSSNIFSPVTHEITRILYSVAASLAVTTSMVYKVVFGLVLAVFLSCDGEQWVQF